MNKAVKNILVTLLLAVLSPVTFALCPCLVTTNAPGKNSVCCCKKAKGPAEQKCPSQKQLIRLQTVEKQRIQDPAPALCCLTRAILQPVIRQHSCRLSLKTAGIYLPAAVQPPSLFLQHCRFMI